MAAAPSREGAFFCHPLRIYWGAGDDEIAVDQEELRKLLDDENLTTGERFADAFYSLCWETKFGAPYPPAWWRGVVLNDGRRYMFPGPPFVPELEARHIRAQWLQVCDADSSEGLSGREMRAEIERLVATATSVREEGSPTLAPEQAGERDALPKRRAKVEVPVPSSQEPEKASATDAGGGGSLGGAAYRSRTTDGNGNTEDRSHFAAVFKLSNSKDEMPEASTDASIRMADPPLRILINMPEDAIRCHLNCVAQLVVYSPLGVRESLFLSRICDAVSAGMCLVSNEFAQQVAAEAQDDRQRAEPAASDLHREYVLVYRKYAREALALTDVDGAHDVRDRVEELVVQVARAGFPDSSVFLAVFLEPGA